MARLWYNVLLVISLPGAAAYYIWRILVARKSNQSWRENLGFLPEFASRPAGRKLIWLHAASVGEVVASLPVLERLRRQLPDCVMLLSTITQTGNAIARRSATMVDAVCYLPLDYPLSVGKALRRVRPDAFVMVEAEMWPNFLSAAKALGAATVLINGRISDRSVRRHRWWGWLVSWAVSNIDVCCMQTEADAERIRSVGARPDAVRVMGSTKFDQDGCQLPDTAIRSLRTNLRLPDEAPVFVAGSTNPGEDGPVIDAFREARLSVPDLRLIVAPRQLERADEVQAMAESAGLRCARRSGSPNDRDPDVLILDTFGELAAIYALADVTFVGGSLIPKGGHSLVQPILQGKPVLFGPHTFKTRDIARVAIASGVGFQVSDAHGLAQHLVRLLNDSSARAEIGATCRRLVNENRGTSDRCAAVIAELALGPDAARQTA